MQYVDDTMPRQSLLWYCAVCGVCFQRSWCSYRWLFSRCCTHCRYWRI